MVIHGQDGLCADCRGLCVARVTPAARRAPRQPSGYRLIHGGRPGRASCSVGVRRNRVESGAPGDASTMASVAPALFTAKLAPQRLPRGAIRRPALVEILGRSSGATLTLICAPAGFGKTTLLTEWVETARTSAPATASRG